MIKYITIINWIAIIVLGVVVVVSLVFPTKGGDAASKGMGEAIVLFACIALATLLLLTILPFNWSKYVAFSIIMLPVAFILLNNAGKMIKDLTRAITYSQTDFDGSSYFSNPKQKALMAAVFHEDVSKVEQLLREPAPYINDLDTENEQTVIDYTATHFSEYSRNWASTKRILELMLAAGATLNSTDSRRESTHVAAIRNATPDMLAFFLEHGANPNAVDENETPMLYRAILTGEEDALKKVKLLIDYGADCNVIATYDRNSPNFSPVLFAAAYGYWDVCWLLIQRGGEGHYVTPNGTSLKTYIDHFDKEFKERSETPPNSFEQVKKLMKNEK
ncbi:hypothetical protein GCM10028807_14170 [Spirosoma daeguense]